MSDRKFVFIILLTLIASHCISQPLKRGDNIYSAYNDLKGKRQARMPAIGIWFEEGYLTAIGDSASPSPDVVFFRAGNNRLFAALNNKEKTVAIDMDGDSIIDVETNQLWVPAWVIKKQSKVSSKDTTVLHALNHLYQVSYQANNQQIDSAMIKLLDRYRTDTSLANRHIMYLFDSYQRLVSDANKENKKPPKELCLPIIDDLVKECESVFGKVPAVVCIYKGEALLNSSQYSRAHEHFKTWLTYYPNSIPLQVYVAKMEENKEEKARKISALKKSHPNHWMVKEL